MSERILITGGTGFVGSHLVDLLDKQPDAEIHVTSFSAKQSELPLPAERIHAVDLSNREATLELFAAVKPTQIYHLASIAETGSSFDRAASVLSSNTAIALNVFEATRQHVPQARILSVGSALEYATFPGENVLTETSPLGPNNPYGVSKVTQEMLAHAYAVSFSLQIVNTRSFNHIGERQAPGFVVSDFARQIAAIEAGTQKSMAVGNLTTKRDFTDVKDTVQAYALLMARGEVGHAYNVGRGTAVSIQTILDKFIELARVPVTVVSDPAKFRPADVTAITADVSKLQALGWNPEIPLDETLSRVLNWWREKI